MDTLSKDLRYAVRALVKHPAFAITAILTLALGIGVSTAIFSVANAVLLRPLPYKDADRLVLVWGEMRARNVVDFPFPPGDFRDLKDQGTLFEDFAAVSPGRQPLIGENAEPEQVRVTGVTPNLLPMLGATMAVGRGFTAEDATPQAQPPQAQGAGPAAGPPPPPLPTSVVLNYGFWKRRFGGDPAIVGKTLDMGGQRAQVVGVLAPGFELLWPPGTSVDASPDMLAAMRINFADDGLGSRINVFLRVVGRLKPGVTLDRANAQVERLAADLRERFPIKKTSDLHFGVVPMHEDLVHDVRPAITALLGAVAFVLLIACANVANLLLVRASSRTREMAVRAALGSSPGRLVRQMLAESLVLAGGAAVLGLLLAYAGIKLLVMLAPANLPRLDAIGLDPVVLAFTMTVSVLAAALFGLVPAVRAARPQLADVLRSSGRSPGLSGGTMLRNGVVMTEVALSFVLLIGCGLMVRSFVALQRQDPGYDPAGVLTFTAGAQSPNDTVRMTYMRQLRERLAGLPGVTAVTAAFPIPLQGPVVNARWGTEEAATDPSKFQQAQLHAVLPGYFEAMRTKLLAGRTYTDADNRPDFTGIVIDRKLAAKAFPGQNAVGKRLYVRSRGVQPEWMEVIGVVEHERYESLSQDSREAIFFTDGWFSHGFASSWVVRTSRDPSTLAGPVRAAVAELDRRVPVAELQPYSALVDRAMAPTRFALVLIGVFAAIAVVLAVVGLYGVLSTVVRQRTAEIGVRMAFGAESGGIFRLVIGQGLKLSGAGIAAGLLISFFLTKVMNSMLVGVGATDPATFATIAALFLVIAAAACWLPARRAAALDPTAALREE